MPWRQEEVVALAIPYDPLPDRSLQLLAQESAGKGVGIGTQHGPDPEENADPQKALRHRLLHPHGKSLLVGGFHYSPEPPPMGKDTLPSFSFLG